VGSLLAMGEQQYAPGAARGRTCAPQNARGTPSRVVIMARVPAPVDRFDLETLEFHAVQTLLTERLATPLGRTAVAALRPFARPAEARRALAQAAELAARLRADDRPPLAGVAEVRGWLDGFFAGERLLDPRELADLKRLLRAAVRAREWLARDAGHAALVAFAAEVPDARDLAEELELIVDDRGEILSSASTKLGQVRAEIDAAEAAVRASVHRFLADERVRRALQSPEPSWRHGRPVFQVRQEHRQLVPGVLHDRSQSGATLFVEPSMVVEAANRLSDARAAEHREIQVVLAHVGKGLQANRALVDGTIAAVVQLDLAVARARLVQVDGFHPAPVVDDGPLRLVGALHPILLRRQEGREQLVPLDVSLGEGWRLLVITGPNTGGKTVVLKTIGLLAVMALCGVPVPAQPGTQFPLLDGVFADIGDEQGISQNLSTFSSHVTRIVRGLALAGPRSLVLFDELGAGTDPEEGGVLGHAVLEELLARGTLAVVTTHLGRLKEFAALHAGAVNGSMAFDGATLRPLYKLEVGVPGASHALDIAARVGVPGAVIARARELLGRRDSQLERVVERVHVVRREAEAERVRTLARAREVAETEEQVRQRLQDLERRYAWLEEEADHLLEEELRRARALVEGPLKQLQNAPRPHGEQARDVLARLHELLVGSSVHRRRMKFLGGLRADDVVFVPRLQKRCVVRKVDRVREVLTVLVGKMPVEVPFEDVSWLQPLDQGS
jgi:DNA mismatch repair protein MutS2